jgi:hypothetical protein
MVKRIVRVRTFVAIRYWLLTFFNVDFLPNRELRLSLAGWLNALIRDPILKIHSDGLVRFTLLTGWDVLAQLRLPEYCPKINQSCQGLQGSSYPQGQIFHEAISESSIEITIHC